MQSAVRGTLLLACLVVAVTLSVAERIDIDSEYNNKPLGGEWYLGRQRDQNRDIQERVELTSIGGALGKEGGSVAEGRRHLTKRSPVNPFCLFCLTEALTETLTLAAKKTVKTSKKTGKTLIKIPGKQIPGKLLLKPTVLLAPLAKFTKKDKKYDKKKDKKTKSYITDPCIIPRKFIKSAIVAVIACPLPNPIAILVKIQLKNISCART